MDLPVFEQFAPCAYLPLPLCDVYRATVAPKTMSTNLMSTNLSMMESIGAPSLRWVLEAGRGYALQWGINFDQGTRTWHCGTWLEEWVLHFLAGDNASAPRT
jgi:hypothetical protein